MIRSDEGVSRKLDDHNPLTRDDTPQASREATLVQNHLLTLKEQRSEDLIQQITTLISADKTSPLSLESKIANLKQEIGKKTSSIIFEKFEGNDLQAEITELNEMKAELACLEK